MPHPKMRESIMTSPENTALAEELLPCTYDDCAFASADEDGPKDPDAHWKECPSFYRPAVALALQSKDDSAALEIDRLKGEIARLRAALEPFAEAGDYHADPEDAVPMAAKYCHAGRAALQTDGGKSE